MIISLPITSIPLDRPKGVFKPCMWCGGTLIGWGSDMRHTRRINPLQRGLTVNKAVFLLCLAYLLFCIVVLR